MTTSADASPARRKPKLGPWFAAAGLALLAALLALHDGPAILALLVAAGPAVLLVALAHLPQTALAAEGWRRVLPAEDRPGLRRAVLLRWIKEGVNALLPVVQLGGDVVRARLAIRRGMAPGQAAAAALVDGALQSLALAAFILLGVSAAAALARTGGFGPELWRIAAVAVALTVGLALVLRFGLARATERLAKVAERAGWDALAPLADADAAVRQLAQRRAGLWSSFGLHLASWLLGGVETWVALQVLGFDRPLADCLMVEALIQAVRAGAFAVPGALGVQEGGFLLLASLLGLTSPQALALSLLRRVRELILGLPALLAWRVEERRTARLRLGRHAADAERDGDAGAA